MESSFLELKSKQVINTVDGKCLGHIQDIIFHVGTSCVLGFIVPQSEGGFFGLFKGNRELFIPYDCVCKIGVDVILVDIMIENKTTPPKLRGKEIHTYADTSNNNEQK